MATNRVEPVEQPQPTQWPVVRGAVTCTKATRQAGPSPSYTLEGVSPELMLPFRPTQEKAATMTVVFYLELVADVRGQFDRDAGLRIELAKVSGGGQKSPEIGTGRPKVHPWLDQPGLQMRQMHIDLQLSVKEAGPHLILAFWGDREIGKCNVFFREPGAVSEAQTPKSAEKPKAAAGDKVLTDPTKAG
jgi:hypothetical protein